MKKVFKKKDAYTAKDVCYEHKDLDNKGCLKNIGQEDSVTLKEVMNDKSFTPKDRIWWLYHKSLNALEKQQLGEYLKDRYFKIFRKPITSPSAISFFITDEKSPITNIGEFNSLLKHLNLL